MRLLSLAVVVLTAGCTVFPPLEAKRTYQMAFTPFPWAGSTASLDDVYAKIGANADTIVHHFDNGIPWAEAVTDTYPYNADLMAEWNSRQARVVSGQKVMLQMTPINLTRDGLAPFWNASGQGQALTPPWDTYPFNALDVKNAYLNYAKRAITFFNPDYISVGIEVNLLNEKAPTLWLGYVDLQTFMYNSLKALYPSKTVVVSLTGQDLLSGYTSADATRQTQARTAMASVSDWFCLSMYVYESTYATNSLPSNVFDLLASLTAKPMAICETGYPSVSFATVGPPAVNFVTDETKQDQYLALLFTAAHQYSFPLVNHWLVRDYGTTYGTADLDLLFAYVGLWDEAGNGKQALTRWQTEFAKPYSPTGL